MNKKLLYFPYCDIPENSWTVKSLLYWDNVGIIVPPSFIDNPDRHNKFTIDLLQTDLIESVFPYNYTHQVKNFDKGFIELVNDPKFPLKKRQKRFENGYLIEIYIQKFGSEIMKHLIDLKLAKKKNWESFYVESKTGNLIMLYLASVIGKTGNFTLATDEISNLDISISQTGSIYKLNKLREKILDDLIPFPVNPSLTKLRKFKDKYYQELESFRILIEQATLEISMIKDKYAKESRYSLRIQEILDKKAKILSDLNESKFKQISFGTICGLGTAAFSITFDNKPLAAFSIANSLYTAFQGYGNKASLTKDYSYLALIDKKFNR